METAGILCILLPLLVSVVHVKAFRITLVER